MIDARKIICVDVECDGLLEDVTKIHCMNTRVLGSNAVWHPAWYEPSDLDSGARATLPADLVPEGTVEEGLLYLWECSNDGYTIVMHNGEGFDIPLLEKFYPTIYLFPVFDTLALSRCLYPERRSHGLAAWGEDLKIAKPVVEDWSRLTVDMLRRCEEDVKITEALWKYLTSHRDYIPGDWLALEQQVMRIHTKQTLHGVRFNIEAAHMLYRKLNKKKDNLEEKIIGRAPWYCSIPNVAKKNQEIWRADRIDENLRKTPLQLIQCGVKPFKGNGELTKITEKYIEGSDHVIEGPYTKVTFAPLNLNSTGDVKDFLQSEGWKPTEWNYSTASGRKMKTSPKLTEDSYKSLPDGLGQDIAQWNILRHRCNFLFNEKEGDKPNKGALANPRLRKDGRVSADAITCGTPTARYRHSGTVCNIPRPSTPYGKDIRALFCVPRGSLMLGLDLKGIEARMLAHYIIPFEGGPALAEIITEGDFHQHNADLWEVDRDSHAKSGLYALMYGCYPPKLAETLGKPKSEGDYWYDKFWDVNEPIKLLVEALEEQYDLNDGKIMGLDGRWLFVREKRKLLNTLLQNAATMVFKRWMIMCDALVAEDPKINQTIAYHDELQFESNYSDTETRNLGDGMCILALKAGEHYNCRVTTPADPKVGINWFECH